MKKQTVLAGGAGRISATTGVLAWLLLPALASAQVTAPRYRGTVEAPTPQLTLPAPPPLSSPNAAVVEDIIARVNDQVIDRSDLIRQQTLLQQQAQQGKISPTELSQMQRDLLREMIDEQLLLSRGKEMDLNVDAEVVRQQDEIRKQNHLDSMEALEKAVRDSGISYEDWRADLKNRMIRQTVIRDEVGRTLHRPTPKDEQAYFDAHKQEFVQPEKVRLSEILIPTPENATDAQVAQAQAKADEVATKLKGGAAFADLAKQYSGGQTADKGGDLGQFEKGQLAKVLEDKTFNLKPGEWTDPIRTRQGFVVLEVTEHNPGGVPALKDVEEQVQEGMYQEQMQPALRKYLTDLRGKAYIDIAPGFTDSGATGKEIKPIFASNTPPPLKKKSAEQKQRMVPSRAAAFAPTTNAAATTSAPAPTAGTAKATVQPVSATPGKKRKKVRREKIRFGQAPQNALPPGPNQTIIAGEDQGPGANSSVLPSTTVADDAPAAEQSSGSSSNLASNNPDPLAPTAATTGKTRFSDRAAEESARKAQEKATKVRQKAMEKPTPLTADEKATTDVQNSALGLGGDNATKKKRKRDKNAPKERLQEQAPAPPAPKPDATPIPPRTVRENGEPATTPAPTSNRTTLPPATAPAPGAPVDTQPATPADPVPHPMPQQ